MIGFNHLGKLGQLGNQMFQYAATKGIAAHRGYDMCIPQHDEVFPDGIGNLLKIELDNAFTIHSQRGIVGRSFAEQLSVIPEGIFQFNEYLFNNCPDNVSLYGFFQTEKYFKHIEDEIRKDFKFNSTIQKECEPIVDEVFDQSPIALHIRRGDFLINSGNHYNLSLEWYEKSLSKFDSDREVILFSDDPLWISSQELFKPDRFIISEGNSSYHDLYLMTQCSDFIIANSTFSWWGAWLANTGRVIAPSKWFGPNNAHLNTQDLYPEHWEII
jgi:hypothetical protein